MAAPKGAVQVTQAPCQVNSWAWRMGRLSLELLLNSFCMLSQPIFSHLLASDVSGYVCDPARWLLTCGRGLCLFGGSQSMDTLDAAKATKASVCLSHVVYSSQSPMARCRDREHPGTQGVCTGNETGVLRSLSAPGGRTRSPLCIFVHIGGSFVSTALMNGSTYFPPGPTHSNYKLLKISFSHLSFAKC